jgi:hypothetical protein
MRRRALSLIEIVVGLALLVLVLPLALNLIPSSMMVQRRAADTEAAVGVGMGWLEETRSETPLNTTTYSLDIPAGQTNFQGTRAIYSLDAYSCDVVILLQPPRGEPIQLAERILHR